MTRLHAREHDAEPQHGLPECLPATERLLWQGAPDWRRLARHGFHVPWLVAYFGALAAWRAASAVADGQDAFAAASAAAWTLPPALLAIGFVVGLAWLVQRTTCYTLTDRRLVLRIGVVLSVSFNLPLTRLEAVDCRRHGDGSGDLALRLRPGDRIGVLHLWPHVRPWRFTRAEPMLRALPAVEPVAHLLAEALKAGLQPDERAATARAGAAPGAEAPARGTALPHAA